jgi:hypothetical protein
MPSLVEQIAGGARSESEVWAAALRTAPDWEPVFSALVPDDLALGLETVYEAYLVHYGRPRLFDAPEPGEAILLGDYLYAHGLVRIAHAGGVPAVAVLAELIATCAAQRADGTPDDGSAWVSAARALGGAPSPEMVERAVEAHCARVAP